MDIQEIRRLCMVREVDSLPNGHTRIETGFVYPDGSSIDVFLPSPPQGGLFPEHILTDFGQTMGHLLMMGVRPWTSKKRQAQVEDVVRALDVRLDGGALRCQLANDFSDMQDGIIRLGQACLRVSDLVFTRRMSLQTQFVDDVEEFLGDAEFEYERRASIQTPLGDVVADFLVRGARSSSAVLTLSTRTQNYSRNAVNEVFRKAHDLAAVKAPEQRVTLVDDSSSQPADHFRPDDLRHLEVYSVVLPFSEKEAVQRLLAA